MSVGTLSVLLGAHQFVVHPLFVALAWWKLYGFPWDPRLWLAFFVHDLGYLGKPNMDGREGERHVELGARIMHWLFDRPRWLTTGNCDAWLNCRWHDFCLYHSRFRARQDGRQVSRLAMADKLALALEPWWLYLPRVCITGEVAEYMQHATREKYKGEPNSKYEHAKVSTGRIRDWHAGMTSYMGRWAYEHRDGRPDTWTPSNGQRVAGTRDGVWV